MPMLKFGMIDSLDSGFGLCQYRNNSYWSELLNSIGMNRFAIK